MRRVLMGCVVLFVAACGGGAVPQSGARPVDARNAIPTDAASAALVESLTRDYGADAVDTCLAAWQDAKDVHPDGAGPDAKPGAGFRTFLSECVGAPAPGNLRSSDGAALRIERSSDLRSSAAQ